MDGSVPGVGGLSSLGLISMSSPVVVEPEATFLTIRGVVEEETGGA
jgi:hypothetical protein